MRRLILFATAAVAALLLSSGKASAYTLSVNVPANPPSPASGSYTVVLTSTDNVNYGITVYGNNDGNGSPSNPSALPAKHSSGTIGLSFLDGGGNYVQALSASGGTTTGGGQTGGAWLTVLGDAIRFLSPSQSNDIAPYGGNQFNGSFVLSNANAISVDIAMQDGSQQWYAPGNAIPNTPEPASLAMVLPGVLPLGMLMMGRLRRRRSARAACVTS